MTIPVASSGSPDVTVVIVNWNTRQLLKDCLASLVERTRGCSYEVIVVDNASGDGSVAMVEATFPSVRLLVNASNLGFAAGCNLGIEKARGRQLLLLNSDTRFDEDALATLVRFLDAHPEAGLVSCALRNADGSSQPSIGHFPRFFGAIAAKFRQLGRHDPGPWRNFDYPFLTLAEHEREQDVDWVAGAVMLARREVVAQVGGMDESIFLFAEEWDWCHRIRSAGWRILFTPTARVVHLGSGSWVFSEGLLNQSRRAGIFAFSRKHYGAASATGLQLLAALGAGTRTLRAAIRLIAPGNRAEARQGLRQAWQAFRWAASPAARQTLKSQDLEALTPRKRDGLDG